MKSWKISIQNYLLYTNYKRLWLEFIINYDQYLDHKLYLCQLLILLADPRIPVADLGDHLLVLFLSRWDQSIAVVLPHAVDTTELVARNTSYIFITSWHFSETRATILTIKPHCSWCWYFVSNSVTLAPVALYIVINDCIE